MGLSITRLALTAVMVCSCTAWAAAQSTLTAAQLTTLKANVLASSDQITTAAGPACAGFVGTAVNAVPNTPDANLCLAAVYSLNASPDFWVWRTAVTKNEFVTSVSVDGTTFNWVGNGFITRAAGEQVAWRELFNGNETVNPSLANVRQAFTDIFSGTGNAAANRTHLATVARRRAKRGERLFTTGTGSTGSPGLLVFEGDFRLQDIEAARNLP